MDISKLKSIAIISGGPSAGEYWSKNESEYDLTISINAAGHLNIEGIFAAIDQHWIDRHAPKSNVHAVLTTKAHTAGNKPRIWTGFDNQQIVCSLGHVFGWIRAQGFKGKLDIYGLDVTPDGWRKRWPRELPQLREHFPTAPKSKIISPISKLARDYIMGKDVELTAVIDHLKKTHETGSEHN